MLLSKDHFNDYGDLNPPARVQITTHTPQPVKRICYREKQEINASK